MSVGISLRLRALVAENNYQSVNHQSFIHTRQSYKHKINNAVHVV